MFIVLSVALLIFCRKRARKEPPMETEYVSDTETNRLYEEIREVDRGSSYPPAETSTVYSYAKPNGVESTDEYSLVTAATFQKKTKDDPGNLNYSEVDFSNSGAASLHRAPCGYTDNALYSDPRVAQSSDVSHAEDASPLFTPLGLINALNLDRTGTEGADITVLCSFTFPGGRKLFCKGKCEEGNILVETTRDSEKRGRYSIDYKEGTYPVSETILYVGIAKLTRSDAGRYQCGLDRYVLDSYQDIEIRVTEGDSNLFKTKVTLRPFPTSVPSASTLTTTQILSSVPSSASPERTMQPQQGPTAPDGHGVVLYVRLTLVVMVIVLSASVLIFCRKRARKPRETADEAEYVNVTELILIQTCPHFLQADRECEEVREEDRGSRSPPIEILKRTRVNSPALRRICPSVQGPRPTAPPVVIQITSSTSSFGGLINALNLDRTETEGADITVLCSFSFPGGRKIFCKGKCEEGNILVETTGDSEKRGRYSIEYKGGTYPVSETILYVGIANLTRSDAGWYQCGLVRSALFPDSHQDIEIRVTEAPTSSKPKVTLRPFPTSVPSAPPERTTQPQQGQRDPDVTVLLVCCLCLWTRKYQSKQSVLLLSGAVLYVGLILVAMFIVLSVALLIFCRKRARKEPPMKTEYVSDTETNRLYEEIREVDRGSSSPPAETSTVYSYAKPNQPNGVESTDEYSLVTAATFQKKTKDDPGNLNYSKVDFSNSGVASLHSAPCGYTDNALYSDPRVAQSSDTKDDPINLNYSEVDSSNSSAASLHSAPCGDADNVLSAPRGTEGGDITVSCPFYLSGKRKIFCKGDCGKGDTLLQTTAHTAQKGRYSIRFKEGTAFPYSDTVLYVGITKLTKSDAGRYKCGFGRVFSPSYMEFEIRVEDGESFLDSSNLFTVSNLSLHTDHHAEFKLRTFISLPERTTQPQQGQTASDGVVLYVRLTLVIMVIVLSASVLIFCRKRARKPRALRDGNSGLTNAQNFVHTRTEGDNIKVGCSFPFPGGRKMFCKGKCEEGNILVETTIDSAQRGRYSIRYVAGTFPARETVLYVSITKLTKSDAGWYQCGLEDRPFPLLNSYQDFEIRVTDASLTSAPSASSLSSVPSSASPERTTHPQQGPTAPAGHGTFSLSFVFMDQEVSECGAVVRLTLVVMVIVLSASVLIFCRKRARKPRETADEAEYVNVTELILIQTCPHFLLADRECEEVREEDRGSRSPPIEMSTAVYYIKYSLHIFSTALRDGNSGLTNAQNLVRTGTEGDNIKVGCSFPLSRGRKMFCKGKCEEGNILVETTGDSAQRGRYSIRYVAGTFPARETVLYVSITKLTKSDAGWYQCGLKFRFGPDSYRDFEIRVTDAPASLTSAPSASSLSSVPSSASPERTTHPQQGPTAPAGHGVVLYVRLTLVVMVIVLSASVLIFCRKRARKPRETADEAEYVNVTELILIQTCPHFLLADRECEEVREEDRGSRSPPVEMSVLSTSHCRHFSEDKDPCKLTCFEEDLSLRAGPSPHSAPCGDPDNVLYFVLWD
ncbi:hypothetical protein F7725_001077 [Dissostichus mawsoni]|uniref:Immunoglobulin domain-containing protein n=1 Tax=Dissostichus mawsoni TaxID=36200 RepID=A0A7J5ZG76_DISMA|nr:hypothetical protein F7725_001077 [Dissostichus mawsoni]